MDRLRFSGLNNSPERKGTKLTTHSHTISLPESDSFTHSLTHTRTPSSPALADGPLQSARPQDALQGRHVEREHRRQQQQQQVQPQPRPRRPRPRRLHGQEGAGAVRRGERRGGTGEARVRARWSQSQSPPSDDDGTGTYADMYICVRFALQSNLGI